MGNGVLHHSLSKTKIHQRGGGYYRHPFLNKFTMNPNVKALLDTIARSEGADYNSLFGDSAAHPHKFTNFSSHPKEQKIPPPNGFTVYTNQAGQKINTSAAGRYQIIYPTYLGLCKMLGVSDFGQQTQDLMGEELLKECGAYEYIVAGNLQEAVTHASHTWASLPGSNVHQPMHSYIQIQKWYEEAGGTVS
jgi:muramidase (phage lysozyme)